MNEHAAPTEEVGDPAASDVADVAVGEVVEAEAALTADFEALVSERDELKALAQRLQADFENYKKRMMRDQTTAVEQANARLLESLMPVLDSFEYAARSMTADDADVEKLRSGVLGAIRLLDDAVAKAGLERIDAMGVGFDPAEHEAVMQDDGDGDPRVGEVLRSGYRLKGRVLRPAMVKITKE
jgi:molecular chaperone GrpE